MNWFKRKFARWSKEAWEEERKENTVSLGGALTVAHNDPPPKMRFAIREALNGKFIEVGTYTQQRGADWVIEYYLVPEGKKVSEALAMLMLIKGADDAPSR